MGQILENKFLRRLVTIPLLYIGFALLTLSLPVTVVIAFVVDLIRQTSKGTPAMATRMLFFAWAYALGECWALITMTAVSLLGRRRSMNLTYRLQQAWLNWNFNALKVAFDLEFAIVGHGEISPGPILLLSRHASLIDTMLPGRYVAGTTGIRLRYILKQELLVDPALDIGGNRLPNLFIDRSGNAAAELANIRALATGLTPDDGVLIYPEGTRYSPAKRDRYVKRIERRNDPSSSIARTFRRVLPPRPAGSLALIESSRADVVFLAHRGLEGFASISDIWAGGLVGALIELKFWRVKRTDIPTDRADQLLWLYENWADMDSWVIGRSAMDDR